MNLEAISVLLGSLGLGGPRLPLAAVRREAGGGEERECGCGNSKKQSVEQCLRRPQCVWYGLDPARSKPRDSAHESETGERVDTTLSLQPSCLALLLPSAHSSIALRFPRVVLLSFACCWANNGRAVAWRME